MLAHPRCAGRALLLSLSPVVAVHGLLALPPRCCCECSPLASPQAPALGVILLQYFPTAGSGRPRLLGRNYWRRPAAVLPGGELLPSAAALSALVSRSCRCWSDSRSSPPGRLAAAVGGSRRLLLVEAALALPLQRSATTSSLRLQVHDSSNCCRRRVAARAALPLPTITTAGSCSLLQPAYRSLHDCRRWASLPLPPSLPAGYYDLPRQARRRLLLLLRLSRCRPAVGPVRTRLAAPAPARTRCTRRHAPQHDWVEATLKDAGVHVCVTSCFQRACTRAGHGGGVRRHGHH